MEKFLLKLLKTALSSFLNISEISFGIESGLYKSANVWFEYFCLESSNSYTASSTFFFALIKLLPFDFCSTTNFPGQNKSISPLSPDAYFVCASKLATLLLVIPKILKNEGGDTF